MATPSGHTQVPGKPGFPPFQKETFASQLIWLAICFVALYLLVSRVALPRVASILENRRKRIAADLAEAEGLKQQAETAMQAHEKALTDARNSAQTLANQARDKSAAEAETERKSLEHKLNDRLLEAEKTIAQTKTAAMTNVRGIATDAAAAIVERLIGQAPAPAAVQAAVDGVLKR